MTALSCQITGSDYRKHTIKHTKTSLKGCSLVSVEAKCFVCWCTHTLGWLHTLLNPYLHAAADSLYIGLALLNYAGLKQKSDIYFL